MLKDVNKIICGVLYLSPYMIPYNHCWLLIFPISKICKTSYYRQGFCEMLSQLFSGLHFIICKVMDSHEKGHLFEHQ